MKYIKYQHCYTCNRTSYFIEIKSMRFNHKKIDCPYCEGYFTINSKHQLLFCKKCERIIWTVPITYCIYCGDGFKKYPKPTRIKDSNTALCSNCNKKFLILKDTLTINCPYCSQEWSNNWMYNHFLPTSQSTTNICKRQDVVYRDTAKTKRDL